MRYVIPILSVIFVIGGFTALLIKGGTPERRYEHSACQYRMIYQYTPEEPMGLVTLGGSRMRVATSADHFDEVLAKTNPTAAAVHNFSHSVFEFGKEYILARDFLEVHTPKAMLIQLMSGPLGYDPSDTSLSEIARLTDIPLAMSALWSESKIDSALLVRNIIFQHFSAFDKVGKPNRETTARDCDREDYRLSIGGLYNAERAHYRNLLENRIKKWDIDSPREEGPLRWIDAFHDLSKASGTQFIFIVMTGMVEPLPVPNFEAKFEERTGFKVIVFDPDLHEALSPEGRRDSSHINEKGREVFLPWLVSKIEEKCTRADGCL